MAPASLTSAFLPRLHSLGSRLGWPIAVLYLLHRALRAASGGAVDLHYYRVVTQPVGDGPLLPGRLRGGLEVRVLGAEEARRRCALSQPADLPRRLERGDACLAAFQGDGLVGYLWLCFAPFDDDETLCRFAPAAGEGGAWDFDLSVTPVSRGGGVFAALWEDAWALLRQRGYGWTASRVSAFNDLSLRSHARLGARPVGSLLVLRAGHWRALVSSMRPYLRFATGGTPYARVDVHAAPGRSV